MRGAYTNISFLGGRENSTSVFSRLKRKGVNICTLCGEKGLISVQYIAWRKIIVGMTFCGGVRKGLLLGYWGTLLGGVTVIGMLMGCYWGSEMGCAIGLLLGYHWGTNLGAIGVLLGCYWAAIGVCT